MIRSARTGDSEPTARALWGIWHHLKARQLGGFPRAYSSVDALAEELRGELGRWFVSESADAQQMGFFSFSGLGSDKTYARVRFPERSIRVENFACLLGGGGSPSAAPAHDRTPLPQERDDGGRAIA
jgi:hypothetical protein